MKFGWNEIITGGLAAVLVFLHFSVTPLFSAPTAEPIALAVSKPNSFRSVSLEAHAAYVYDARDNKVMFSKNGDEVLPLASLTKIMTALTAKDLLPSTTVVSVSKKDLENEGDNGLFANEKWALGDLMNFMLIASSNDGAKAVASAAEAYVQSLVQGSPSPSSDTFVDYMNKKALKLGFENMHFTNETGLDGKTSSGGVGSAKDVAHLVAWALHDDVHLFEATTEDSASFVSLSDKTHVAKNTDEIVNKIPMLIASKTGYTDLAGGNLAIAFDAGMQRPIVVVVLGSSIEGRFKDVEALVAASLDYLSKSDK